MHVLLKSTIRPSKWHKQYSEAIVLRVTKYFCNMRMHVTYRRGYCTAGLQDANQAVADVLGIIEDKDKMNSMDM